MTDGIATAAPAGIGWLTWRLQKELGEHARVDAQTRAMYSSDASNYRVVPGLVVAPGSEDELAAVVGLAVEAGVPMTMRGAGTSIAGNAIGAGVVIETRRLQRILAIDPDARTATVQPGVILGDLNARAASHRLRVGPDPSTHSRCTLGGMIGNDACGSRSVRWGTTAQNVQALDVITAGGERIRLTPLSPGTMALPPSGLTGEPLRRFAAAHEDLLRRELTPWPRRVSGYPLDWLLPERGFDVARALVGTEGTCVVVAGATVRLWTPRPRSACWCSASRDDIAAAAAVPALLTERPFTVESLTEELLALVGQRPSGELLPTPAGAWLLVEAGGDTLAEAEDHARRLARDAGPRASRVPTCGCCRARPPRAPSGASARMALAMPRDCRMARPRGPGSRTPRCRPTDWRHTSPTSTSCSGTTACAASPTATSARAASTCGSASAWTSPAARRVSAASWRRGQTSSRVMAGRCPASMATAVREVRCCPGCSRRR